jgi:hypothetical protein
LQVKGKEKWMEETSLSSKLSLYLLQNFEISFNKSGSIRVNDFSLAGNGLAKKFFNAFLSDRSKYKDIHEPFLILSDKDIIEEVSNVLPSIKDKITSHMQEAEYKEITESSEFEISKDSYLNAVPIVDIGDKNGKSYMFDKVTQRVLPVEEKAWEKLVGSKHANAMREVGYGGRFNFNPTSLEPFTKIHTSLGTEVEYNTFIPPAFRLERDRSLKLDPIFIDFLNGLFLDSCKDYAFNWLYHSCFNRVPIYLVLVGAGGIGKNLLAEALKMIHGSTNFIKAPPSALDTKFNGHLQDCTMLYYDECKFSAGREGVTTRKNRLKEWANDFVPIEVKGVDAVNKNIYCSAIIATNNDSDVHLERLDRKFSVMELSEDRLEKRMGLKNTHFLWEYIKTPEFANAFLNYLEDQINPDFNIFVEYKGAKFDQLVLSSLYGWQTDLLDRIQTAQTKYIPLKVLKEEIPLFPRHNTKVLDFLKNFTIEENSLGTIVTIDGKYKIKIDDALLPKEIEDSSLDKLE